MRWNDMELLQLIDELEQTGCGLLSIDFTLTELARSGKDIAGYRSIVGQEATKAT